MPCFIRDAISSHCATLDFAKRHIRVRLLDEHKKFKLLTKSPCFVVTQEAKPQHKQNHRTELHHTNCLLYSRPFAFVGGTKCAYNSQQTLPIHCQYKKKSDKNRRKFKIKKNQYKSVSNFVNEFEMRIWATLKLSPQELDRKSDESMNDSKSEKNKIRISPELGLDSAVAAAAAAEYCYA